MKIDKKSLSCISRGDALTSSFARAPHWMLNADLSPSEKLAYILLLDRVLLSASDNSGKWCDADGRAFCYFKTEALAHSLRISVRACQSVLGALAEAGLIARARQGQGLPSRIYVFAPWSARAERPGNRPAAPTAKPTAKRRRSPVHFEGERSFDPSELGKFTEEL